jgi:hypothetical protein
MQIQLQCFGAVCLLVGLVSCASLPDRRSARFPYLLPPVQSDLLASPRTHLYDYTYPPHEVRQVLSFGGKRGFVHSTCTIDFGTAQYGYGGLVLRYPLHLQPHVSRAFLTLCLEHSADLSHISIGLVDGETKPPRVMVELPLSHYIDTTGNRFDFYPIPLSDFSVEGVDVYATNNVPGAKFAFDWDDVREVRFIWSNSVGIATGPFILYHIHINFN